ncbi:glycosyltransferase family 2 protein [Acetobacter conturbans]|uniref:Glycosyltransferase n=1 Tax=Acetobacter conturbans TaxID=1737472 RepID=A0ABX0K0M4_9PROT|nr:glycosyltransferase family A protein [Acetobacter conturbans]NHN89126.1 glycosyltransferase [Acetobacter conturbans]
MRFSLIIPTLNRPEGVRAFLGVIAQQSVRDVEVIVVDQSGSDIYDAVIRDFSSSLTLKHIRTDVRKCRYACNLGAAAASGEIIAFPDDDCLYRPDTLEQVDARFRNDARLGLLTGPIRDIDGRSSNMGRWLTADTPLNERNIWIGLIEFNMFIRRTAFEQVGGFDLNMGPGCRFVAAEGQDLGLRLLHSGVEGYFDSRLLVMHPDKSTDLDLKRAKSYGCGMGYALRKNHAPVTLVLTFLIRPAGGALLNLLKGHRALVLYFCAVLLGRLDGYCSREARQVCK